VLKNQYSNLVRILSYLLIAPFLLMVSYTFAAVSSIETTDTTDTTETMLLGYDSKFATLNGLKFHYVQKGNGERIVFIHGYPFFAASWDKLLTHFSQSYHVVAPDNRGYGLSAKPEGVENYTIDKLVEDVKALIEHLPGSQKVNLVGHDWGGLLAWAVAQKYPELVNKIVVINAPPYNVMLHMAANNEEQAKASDYMEKLKSPGIEKLFEQHGPEMLWRYGFNKLYAGGDLDDEFKAAFFAAWQQPGAFTSAVNWYRANIPLFADINDSHYWPSKDARVTVPSLLIWSERESVFVPAMLDEIPKYVDDLSITIISDSGHSPFFDKTKEVSAAMQEFFDK
jgi:pimeloyl-ACP methyl ester carboxylesterase